jgi:hypothetical protein
MLKILRRTIYIIRQNAAIWEKTIAIFKNIVCENVNFWTILVIFSPKNFWSHCFKGHTWRRPERRRHGTVWLPPIRRSPRVRVPGSWSADWPRT